MTPAEEQDTPGHHIAQDVLSGVRSRVAPHRPTANYTALALSVEYTRSLLPWAKRLVCFGKDRSDRVGRIRNVPRVEGS